MSHLNLIIGATNLFCAGLAVALAYPMVKRKVKMNHVYGVRFARAFESEEAWYAMNEYGGRRMIFWSMPLVVVGAASFFVPLGERPALLVPFAMAPVVYVIPAFETWLYGKRLRG